MKHNNPLANAAEVQPLLSPKDHNGGAIASNYLNMGRASRIALVIQTGTIAGDVTLKVEQAKDGSGTGVKDLTLRAAGAYQRASATKAPQPDAALIVSGEIVIPNADDDSLIIVEVLAEDLDRNNDFTHIRLSGDDPAVSAFLSANAVAFSLQDPMATGEPSILN